MDEQDFDKLYSSKLPDFTSSDWRAMEGALDRHDLKRKLTRLMWALPVLGGLLLGVSAMMFYHLKQTQDHVKNLENQLVSAFEKKHLKVEGISPPIIIHDTIYKHIVVRQIVRENYPENTNDLTNNLNNIYYEKYDKTNTENQIVLEREKFIGLSELEGKGILNSTKMSVPRDFLAYKGEMLPEDSLIEESRFSLIPKSVILSALGGVQQLEGDEFEYGKGFNLGFRTVLGYHNSKGQERWGVVLDVQQNNFLLGNKKDKNNGSGPKPNGGQNQPLRKVEIPQFSAVQIGVGLRYNLLFSEKIKPYFGLNWSFQIPTNYDTKFSFEDPNTSNQIIKSQQTMMHLLGGSAGLNVQLSKRFAVGGEVFYQSPISKITSASDVNIPNALGGRVGVSYRIF
ncbi:MAG: hypothetical protein U5N85_16810 [Arcicella sp.]|nr:hypothetical protein [Arcicella sp.]